MNKKFVIVALIIAFGLFFFPRGKQLPNQPQALSPEAELTIKRGLVASDVQMTDDLCRYECALSLKKTMQQIDSNPATDKKATLQGQQKKYPHMRQLIWTRRNIPLQQGQTVGSLNKDEAKAVLPFLVKAKSTVDNGKEYRSESIKVENDTYFVLGIPSSDQTSALVGVVHQKILNQIHEHQVKNLRVVPYPADNNWKIESVDSKTLQDVKVNHPEDNQGTSHYHKHQVVVRFRQQPTDIQLKQIRSEIHAKSMQKLGYTYVFESSNGMEAKQLMNYFKKWDVVYSEPHFLYLTNETPALTPNDVFYSRYQWNLPMIETELGWEVGRGSNDVIVGVVDTGVDLKHTDLQGHLLPGYNVVTPNSDPQDDVGHGTHVAGVISALVNNNEGVAGMTWYNPILPVKVLDQSGSGSTYSVAQGIIWAADHGAKVINMSLGNYAEANFLHDAIKYAFDKDVVLIAASGNDNTSQPGYPAAYPEVFAVAAADSKKNKASFSNFGDYIDVAAPGVNIPSTYPGNQYAALSGTSMASPHVTALAALIRSVNPQLKNTEVMDIMRQTAEDLGTPGKDSYYGYGQIDVIRALQLAKPKNITADANESKKESDTNDSSFSNWLQQLFSSFR